MPIVFSIVGKAKTGKTTLITKLIAELKHRGISVGVIKHCPNGFELDKKGKDSWTFTEAGADGIALIAKKKIGMISSADLSCLPRSGGGYGGEVYPQLTQIIDNLFNNMDIVLVEGFKSANNVNKIEVLASRISRDLCCPKNDLLAVVSDFETALDIKQFKHNDIVPIVNFMERIMDKKIEHPKAVQLKINGKEVPLNPFVQKVIKNINLAVIDTLKTETDNPKEIEILIEL
ncbi:MAG: molybdopterin-guanine dinucleotide biosynthesis protein B [Candidatus Stahlbacteria bacterium]|nr:molybdopterin-guanine dinucleotide biosynthesis protein B [Candidatus Stahlbacteria bacterium]